jgi:predicted HicB family RNase H-like nuclease
MSRKEMTNIVHYKGYIGNVKEDKEIFYGKLEFINDLITFLAMHQNMSLNKYVERALERAIEADSRH